MRFACAVLCLVCAAFGQGPLAPAFEVASVKPSPPDRLTNTRSTYNGIDYQGATLRLCLINAYRVGSYQISGPPWLDDLRYDIVAKMAPPVDPRKVSEMLQTLLAERFKLQIHREKKDFPGYALVVGPAGPKLSKPADGAVSAAEASLGQIPRQSLIFSEYLRTGGMRMRGEHATLAYLASNISLRLGCPVLDLTDLPGDYNFVLEFSRDDMRNGTGGMPPGEEDAAVSVFSSIQTLGLKLKPQKVPLDLIVVDHAEKVPTEN